MNLKLEDSYICLKIVVSFSKLYSAFMYIPNIREKFSSKGALWFVIPLIQIHVDTFGPF